MGGWAWQLEQGWEVVCLFLLRWKSWEFLLELKYPPDRPLFPEVKWTGRGKSHGLQTCKTQVWIKRCGWMQGGCWWWMKLGLVAVQLCCLSSLQSCF